MDTSHQNSRPPLTPWQRFQALMMKQLEDAGKSCQSIDRRELLARFLVAHMRNARPTVYGKADESTVLSFVIEFEKCEESSLIRAVFESASRDDFFDFSSIRARYREAIQDRNLEIKALPGL